MSAPARRAVGRWSLRLLRREWRSQALVTVLITLSVGAAVFGSTAATNLTPSRAAENGTADHRIETTVEDQAALESYLDEAETWFGTTDVIRHATVAVPGSSDPIEVRAHQTDGAYSRDMVAVRSGRRAETAAEVALTDDLVDLLGVDVGDEIELGRATRTVVGVVEDPADLDDEFALVTPDALAEPASVTILVRADQELLRGFRPDDEPGGSRFAERGQDEGTTAALGVLVVATVALMLVSLVAGAAFLTVAQRRQRQLGMLAAIGATPRHLRTAMLAHGLGVGAVSGGAGTLIAITAWLGVAGALEGPAGRRIDRFAVPAWLVAAGAVLALLTAMAAAWWPARAVARLPIVTALSGRPPVPRPARRSIVGGAALVVAGLAGITFGIDPTSDDVAPLLLIPGLIAVGVSALLLAGPALRAAARLSSRFPIGVRLPVRELARAGGRAAASVGAVTLAVGIAFAIILLAAAAEPTEDRGNLAPEQLAVWTVAPFSDSGSLQVPAVTDTQLPGLDEAVDRLAPDATVVPLDVAVDSARAGRAAGVAQVNVAMLGRPVGPNRLRDAGRIFVATPELLDNLGIDETTIEPDTLLLTTEPGPVHLAGDIALTAFRGEPVPADQVQRIDVPDFSSGPRTLITDAGLAATGLTPQRAGWLVEADQPFSAASIGRARDAAEDAGLAIESRNRMPGLTSLRTGAVLVGAGLALGIVALTLGLVRSEGARDAQTLTAVGASRRTRRAIQASTAGALTGVGVILGAPLAYGAVVAGYWGQTSRLSNVPAAHLAALALGLPALAIALSWLLGSRPAPTAAAT